MYLLKLKYLSITIIVPLESLSMTNFHKSHGMIWKITAVTKIYKLYEVRGCLKLRCKVRGIE